MPTTPAPPLFRRISPGAWTACLWCAYTLVSVRAFLGIPLMPHSPERTPAPYDWALLAVATAVAVVAATRLLRRMPLLAFALLLTATFAATIAVDEAEIAVPHVLAVMVAFGAIVADCRRAVWGAASVLALGLVPAYALTRIALGLPLEYSGTLGSSWSSWGFYATVAAAAWLVGNSVRQSRDHAEKVRAEAAERAVAEERLRIARELHDMVAHSIGVIALQAGAARRVIDSRPGDAREALCSIETTGRETLSGLRRMLGALRTAEHRPREPDGDGGGGLPPEAPAADGVGLADLARLAETTTACGVRVDIRQYGTERPLPPEVDRAAYRIVQEAVTNVVRHADCASCRVTVEYGAGSLAVEVVDAGRGLGSGPAHRVAVHGYGIVGMRERVALLDGEFSAGRRAGGGFRVSAVLPLPPGADGPPAHEGGALAGPEGRRRPEGVR
ncbi:sensor histidine kinase [Streptomyces triticagri]|uniref:histidine kinase n=1 Tax=Streptomyces triticagri TaxID=2293568 RepID=A0A372M1K9_9ACTN|nr:sensor histidine kinase [Streptomyces triticagri]RFU84808.1 sensor histidine kinase [Streptomyces triticagri]